MLLRFLYTVHPWTYIVINISNYRAYRFLYDVCDEKEFVMNNP